MQSNSFVDIQVREAATHIQQGKVIAYPTEAVYGLGCDIENHDAIMTICTMKQRDIRQGLIIVAAHWDFVSHYTKPLDHSRYQEIFSSWPGATTWVFPASASAPAPDRARAGETQNDHAVKPDILQQPQSVVVLVVVRVNDAATV